MDEETRAEMIELLGAGNEGSDGITLLLENEVSDQDAEDAYEFSEQVEEDRCDEENRRDIDEEADEVTTQQVHVSSTDNRTFDVMIQDGPQAGMKFDTREILFVAYQAYAKLKGFCISTRNIRANKYLVLACDRGRKPDVKKFTKKVNCPCRLNAIRQDNGHWKVSKVCNTHTHDLVPQMSTFMAAHRTLSAHMKLQLEAQDIAGLRPCKNVRLMEVLAGGPSNLGATTKDCRNFIDKRRRLRLGEGDADAMHKLLKRLQQKDRNFFYLMDIDDYGRLRNVMWIHPRSIAAYEEFHDVVSFDTTYLVNQYNMPFGTIVGVNHHHQSILLGCALLTYERAESFKWFFSNWLEAMGGVQPTSILTDQDESIGIAVREIMPESNHRLCLWHILSKTPKKFKGVEDSKQAVIDFKTIVYDSLNISEVEARWDDFLIQYGLRNNKWLKKLFDIRGSWIPVYLNHCFWAGMVSTQRSESMHAFFDNYITSRSTLKTFLEQYEISVTDKIRNELKADYNSKCRPIQCISPFKWEEQFQKTYTNNVMVIFQKEVKRIWSCNLKVKDSIDGVLERYEISERGTLDNWYHKEYEFTVEYQPVGEHIQCNCRLFDSKGIMCGHILKVLSYKNIEQVHERYILRRWCKDVYRPHSSILFAGGYPHMTKEYQIFQEMEREFVQCTDIAIESEEKIKYLRDKFKVIKEELQTWTPIAAERDVQESAETEGAARASTPILNPVITRGKGRPRMNRIKSKIEKNQTRGSRGRGTTSRGRGGSNGNARGGVTTRSATRFGRGHN